MFLISRSDGWMEVGTIGDEPRLRAIEWRAYAKPAVIESIH